MLLTFTTRHRQNGSFVSIQSAFTGNQKTGASEESGETCCQASKPKRERSCIVSRLVTGEQANGVLVLFSVCNAVLILAHYGLKLHEQILEFVACALVDSIIISTDEMYRMVNLVLWVCQIPSFQSGRSGCMLPTRLPAADRGTQLCCLRLTYFC